MDDEKTGYKGEFVRRRALIDQALIHNEKTKKSLAIKKYVWTGDGGAFKSKDLEEWHNLYNQTKISEVRDLKHGQIA